MSDAYTAADASEQYDRAFSRLTATCLSLQDERDRYEAALRKIAAWKIYEITADRHENGYALTDYERGANDMLKTLKQMVGEALA